MKMEERYFRRYERNYREHGGEILMKIEERCLRM